MAVKLSKQASRATGKVHLPPGYEVITGSFALKWDFTAMPLLEGTVIRLDTLELKRGGRSKEVRSARVMEIETKTGEKYAVWESAALAGFFDQAQKGDQVGITYEGERKIPGQRNTMHDFKAGIKPNGRLPQQTAKTAPKKAAKK